MLNTLVITLEEYTLHETVDEQEFIDALNTALSDVLDEKTRRYDRLTLYDDHIYSQISRTCPDCHRLLTVYNPEFDNTNGAFADAYCPDCGWAGTATYRLIDLLHEQFDTPEHIFDGGSVSRGYVTPEYAPYERTNWTLHHDTSDK